MEEMVVLVDGNDKQIGLEEKLKAHMDGGRLHRSISIIVFNHKGQMMLQKRAQDKYHSQGLWSNTTCSHTMDGESPVDAAHRRLKQEMGFDCPMKEVFTFIYKVPVGNGLTEHEFDHTLFGMYDGSAKPNPEEVQDWKWADVAELRSDMLKNSDNYTGWFNIIMTGAVEKKFNESMSKFLNAESSS